MSRDLPLWRLYIVGDGPDKQKLEDLARTLELQELGQSFSRVCSEFPDPLLKDRIFLPLRPTQIHAAWPSLKPGEPAAVRSLPTAVGGTPELLDFGRAGKLVEAGNVRQLTAELRNFMTSADNRESFRHAAKQGSEFFDVKRVAGDYRIHLQEGDDPSGNA